MSWPSCLALLRFSKVSESTEVTAQRLLRNKLVSGSVRAISNREERDKEGWVSCLTDQAAQDPMGAAG